MALRLKSPSFYSVKRCFLKVYGFRSDQPPRPQMPIRLCHRETQERTRRAVDANQPGRRGTLDRHGRREAPCPSDIEIDDGEIREHEVDGKKPAAALVFTQRAERIERDRRIDPQPADARAPQPREAGAASQRP